MSLAFIIVCFLAIVAMFVYIQKRLERIHTDMLRECEQLRAMIMTLTEAMGADAEREYYAIQDDTTNTDTNQENHTTHNPYTTQKTPYIKNNYEDIQTTNQAELETLPSTLPKGVTVEQLSAMFHSGTLHKPSDETHT